MVVQKGLQGFAALVCLGFRVQVPLVCLGFRV